MTLEAKQQPGMLHSPRLRWLLPACCAVAAALLAALAPRLFLDGFSLCANAVTGWIVARTGRMLPTYAVAAPPARQPLAVGVFAGVCGLLLLGAALFIITGRRPKTLRCKRNTRRALAGPAALLAAFTLLLALAGGLLAARGDAVQSAAAAVRQGIDDLRYRPGRADNLPEGNLVGLTGFEVNDTPALEVVMETPASLYLRGFVGGGYTGRGWRPAEEGLAGYAGLFFWLHEAGFHGQTQLARAAALLDDTLAEAGSRVVVNNLNASSRYAYAPYELAGAGGELLGADLIGDARLGVSGLTGQRTTRYTTLPNQVKRYPELVAALAAAEQNPSPALEAYLINESHYNTFVYERYTQLPDNDRAYLESKLGAAAAEGEAHLPYQAAKQRVMEALEQHLSYSETTAAMGKKGDFLPFLLDDTQTGYSVHYASAATLMFRYFGIPARYVEGYLITPGDVEWAMRNTAITLDGTHAHAWCEIYHDGLGWIPFEVTPPYLDLMEQPDHLEGIDAAAGSQEGQKPARQPDNYEDTPPQTTTGEAARLLQLVLLALLALAATALAALGLARYAKKRKALKHLKSSFSDANNAMAICRLFDYTQRLLAQLPSAGTPRGGQWPTAEDVHAIYQEARYSTHPMDAAARQVAAAYKDEILARLQKEVKLPRRLYLRLVQVLY